MIQTDIALAFEMIKKNELSLRLDGKTSRSLEALDDLVAAEKRVKDAQRLGRR